MRGKGKARSNMEKYKDIWIMQKGEGKCMWTNERKVKVKIKDGKRIKIYG